MSFSTVSAQEWLSDINQPEELGDVHWLRSYDEAISQAKTDGKPVFILFQEIPGCATCRNYGNNLLTHPHIVEAIESYFVPQAIHNNERGEDSRILAKFNEPSWNNPVARIIDPSSESDIVKRLNGKYDMVSLVSFISNALIENRQLIPDYLDLLYQESSSTDLRETHLSMYCFWTGEKVLGSIDGVTATKAGYMNGTEVVKVNYDASRLSEEELITFANKQRCADAVYTDDKREEKAAQKHSITTKGEGKFRPYKQPKYYTYNSDYKYIPMTDLQAIKVNSALSKGESPVRYLSPRQLALVPLIENGKVAKRNTIDKDFQKEWSTLISGS